MTRQERSNGMSIDGYVAPGFERIREVFAESVASGDEAGAAVSVYLHGKPVVDLWGGDARPDTAWRDDTLVCIFSVSKGMTAFVSQHVADRGILQLDQPIAEYWPEFGCNGKGRATARMVLSHTVGLPWFPDYEQTVSFDDAAGWQRTEEIVARLAEATPVWEPGTRHGYHSMTYGWLMGEIVRRLTGQSLGTYLRSEIAEPLGLDLWIGLPASEHHRVAQLVPRPEVADLTLDFADPMSKSLFIGPRGSTLLGVANDPRFWATEQPAVNGIATARSIARVYGLLANGGEIDGLPLVSPQSISDHSAETFRGQDTIYPFEGRTALGYARATPTSQYFGPNDEAFGFRGWGGSIGFADPVAGIGFCYLTRMMGAGAPIEPRAGALVDAVYSTLA